MASRSPVLKLTYDDYLHFPDDGRRHELVDGEHAVTPAPTPRHQAVSFQLARILADFVEAKSLGAVYPAPLDVVLSAADVLQPDLLFLSSAKAGIVTETNLRGAPDLVVEVLSDSSRGADEVTKRHLYEKHGVQEYWIVDPLLDSVKVYRRGPAGGFRREAELSAEARDSLSTPLLPGLAIPLAKIFGPRRR